MQIFISVLKAVISILNVLKSLDTIVAKVAAWKIIQAEGSC